MSVFHPKRTFGVKLIDKQRVADSSYYVAAVFTRGLGRFRLPQGILDNTHGALEQLGIDHDA